MVWKTPIAIAWHSNNSFHLPVCLSGRDASCSLTDIPCLFRICANSIQFLLCSLVTKLEWGLGESAEGLSTHYQSSAQALSNLVPPGASGLMHVQQLFLGATWQKAQAEFVKSWHFVGAAVREAQ